jgi:hypothetical protein
MKLDNKVQVERTCKSFWKLVQPGACDEFDTDWELAAQEEYMQRHCYKYSTEDDTQGNNKGCIAMTGTAALRACQKKLFFLAANGGHGYFLSPSAQGVIGIVSKTLSRSKKRSRRRPDNMPGTTFFISLMDWMVVRIDILNSAIE